MARIGEIVRQVALIALLAAFLEMLLPDKKMTRYVRLVLGLFVVVAILSPLAEGLRLGPEMDVAAWDLRLDPVTDVPAQQGQEIARANAEAALELYRQRLAGQIKALVSLVPGVKTVEAQVSVDNEKECRGAIRRVVVIVTLGEPASAPPPIEVERIEVQPGTKPDSDANNEPMGETAPGEEAKSDLAVIPEPVLPEKQLSEEPAQAPGEVAGAEQKSPSPAATVTQDEAQQLKARIIAMITHFYGLEPGQVEVLFVK